MQFKWCKSSPFFLNIELRFHGYWKRDGQKLSAILLLPTLHIVSLIKCLHIFDRKVLRVFLTNLLKRSCLYIVEKRGADFIIDRLTWWNSIERKTRSSFLRIAVRWLGGLGVWFALRVREVPGSIPGQAHLIFLTLKTLLDSTKERFNCHYATMAWWSRGIVRASGEVPGSILVQAQ